MNEPEVTYINIEPDGLLVAAFNVVEHLERAGMVKFTKKHPKGAYAIEVFQSLTNDRALIKRSSWIAEKPE